MSVLSSSTTNPSDKSTEVVKDSQQNRTPSYQVFWSLSRQEILETFPGFPKSTRQIKESRGGMVNSVFLSKTRLMTSILWLDPNEVIVNIDALSDTTNILTALAATCQYDSAVNIFSNTTCIGWLLPEKAKYVFLGLFQIEEWTLQGQYDHCVRFKRRFSRDNEQDLSGVRGDQTTPPEEDAIQLSEQLFRGRSCRHCLCAMAARLWYGWHCPSCSQVQAAPPLVKQNLRSLTAMPISFSGPRMDSGRIYMEENAGLARTIVVWSDGIKTARYHKEGVKEEALFFHLLCSSHLEETSTSNLNLLLDRSMPYRRASERSIFSASFRPHENVDEPTRTMEPPSQRVTDVAEVSQYCATPAILLTAETIDEATSRFLANDQMDGDPFRSMDVSVCCQGEVIDLLKRTEDVEDGSRESMAVYHLGPDAQLIMKRNSDKRSVLSLFLSHGDLLFIPDINTLRHLYEMRLMHKQTSVTCISRHRQER